MSYYIFHKNTRALIFLILGFTKLSAQLDLSLSAMAIPDSLITNAFEVVREESTVFTVKSEKEGFIKHRRVVTIFNASARGHHLIIPYNKESKVGKIEASIYNAQGQLVRKVEKSEIRDYSAVSDFSIYEDDREKYLEVAYSQYPYTVVIEYEQTMKGVFYCAYPDWVIQQFHAGLQHASYTLSMPANWPVFWRALNIDIQPDKQSEAGRDIYTWTVGNRIPIKAESRAPAASMVLPMVLTAPDKFQVGDYSGSMASWQSFGAFVHQLYQGRDQLSPDLKQVIHKLVDDTADPRIKIDRLYRYMQQQMRYVSVQLGIGGWQPFDASYVWNNKYGDCKALSNFMKAMLQEVGIKAYPALIFGGEPDFEIQPDFAKPFFNHVILHIPEQDYWLECTSKISPPNYLSSETTDRYALLVTENGGQLVRTPAFSAASNGVTQHTKISLDASGAASIDISSLYRGSYHEDPRFLGTQHSQDDFREWVAASARIPSFDIKEWSAQPSADLPECQLDLSLQVPRFASKAGKRLFVPMRALQISHEEALQASTRKQPIVIKESYLITDSIQLILPEAFTIENIPSEKINIKTSFGEFQLQVQKSETQLLLRRQLMLQASTLRPEQLDEYRAFFKEVAKWEEMKIVLLGS